MLRDVYISRDKVSFISFLAVRMLDKKETCRHPYGDDKVDVYGATKSCSQTWEESACVNVKTTRWVWVWTWVSGWRVIIGWQNFSVLHSWCPGCSWSVGMWISCKFSDTKVGLWVTDLDFAPLNVLWSLCLLEYTDVDVMLKTKYILACLDPFSCGEVALISLYH